MFYLGVPVVDNHFLTEHLLNSIVKTIEDIDAIEVVIFDNGSDIPYVDKEWNDFWDGLLKCRVVRSETNRGFYRPITDLADMATPGDIVGLCHNDLIFYEKGWDRRLRECFVQHGNLGIVGFCGSNEVDSRGGRGGGTMMNFKGEKGAQAESTGRRVTDLEPAAILDSLFMAIRQPVVEQLGVDDKIALNHFGDRVWPLRAIENGWHVGVLGVEIDHMGGQTLVLVSKIEEDSRKWLEENEIPIPEGMSAGTAVYLESERRYLEEYRDRKRMIPGRVNYTWGYRRDGV